MPTLYGVPGSASLAPHILFHEGGEAVEFVVPTRDGPDAGPPEFLAASPLRKVPVLIDGDLVLVESSAICMHIADRNPQAGLAPPPGDPARGEWYRWLVYLANTVQPALYQFIYPERFSADDAHVDDTRALAVDKLRGVWDWIDSELGERDTLVGDSFGAADAYLWMLMRWSRRHPEPAFGRPNLGRFWTEVGARPAVLRVRELEGLEPVG